MAKQQGAEALAAEKPKSAKTASRNRGAAGKKRNGQTGAIRRRRLLDAAAKLFSSFGYTDTSMRDIAREAGILSGSVYYHFESKEELLLAVHEQGVSNILEGVDKALAGAGADPWERLEAACVGHLEALLVGGDYAQVVTPEFPRRIPDSVRARMIAQRNAYEAKFRELIDALPLPAGIDKGIFRLGLMGSLNWTLTWYRPGRGATAKAIARQFLRHYREAMQI